jgi:hypothetical protein
MMCTTCLFASLVLLMFAAKKRSHGRWALVAGTLQTLSNLCWRLSISMEPIFKKSCLHIQRSSNEQFSTKRYLQKAYCFYYIESGRICFILESLYYQKCPKLSSYSIGAMRKWPLKFEPELQGDVEKEGEICQK